MQKTKVVLRSLCLILVAACGKHAGSDPAPCDAVGAKVRTIAHADLVANKELAPTTRHDAELELGPLESEVADTCREQKWPVDVRGCMVKATTGAGLQTCAATLTPEQRGVLPKSN
jgi:hypothetical protein